MNERLNPQALTLEEAQNEIRLAVKDAYFMRSGTFALNAKVDKIIKRALARIRIPSLREAARRSLLQYYYTQKQNISQISITSLAVYLALLRLSNAPTDYTRKLTSSSAARTVEESGAIPPEFIQKGVPLMKYSEDYFRDHIKPVLDRMASEEAQDPSSEEFWGKRSSLRNRAEREVRHQGHIDNIADLRSKGARLVIISAHADCSDRCHPFQGRVFSLDGTSGTTPDGRHYEPLENATDIYTPNGKWKNGLFGFNCRHYAVEYKDGYSFPAVSVKTERREYAITERQRALERNVRKWKARAEMYKGTDRAKYKEANLKAKQWQSQYESFSRAHDRAYYPERLKTLDTDHNVLTFPHKNDIIYVSPKFSVMMADDKFVSYSLNSQKAPNKAKAFKEALGYDQTNYAELKQNIIEHIEESKFVSKGDLGHGMRYECIIELTGPNGKSANVLTAWIQNGDYKRLTSVYVTKKKGEK